jgi:hypothetical protein
MVCGLCHREFGEEAAVNGCKGCPMGGCKRLRCPHCGYEMPPEPRWLRWIIGRKKHVAK